MEEKDGYYKHDKDDDKCVSVLMSILLNSIQIQFFSHNQSLLLLSLIPIQIIITRMTHEEKRQLQYSMYSTRTSVMMIMKTTATATTISIPILIMIILTITSTTDGLG